MALPKKPQAKASRAAVLAARGNLLEAMLEDLARSGLEAEDARAMKLRPGEPDELQELGLPAKASYVIPYLDMNGKPTGFRRWRYLEDTREGLAKQTDKKPIRYVQASDTLPGVYFPPHIDWRAVAADTSQTIVVTEGEKKAAAVCKMLGVPCIGLGGVYSFKSNKRRQPLLQVFYEIDWQERDVIVAYDSDTHTNHMVLAARAELCRELTTLGAIPRVADIPDTDEGRKQGIDDLLVAEGADYVQQVLDVAESFAQAAALHVLNTEVAYIRNPGLIAVLEDCRTLSARDFVSHAYSNRHYWESAQGKAGAEGKMVKQSAAKAWLEWEQRFELRKMTYAPGKPRVTDECCFNTWPGWGVAPKKGNITPWRKLLDRLFDGYPRERQWFERWCAIPLQRPGTKMFSCAVIWGVETGTGKSLVGKTLGRIYGQNYTLIDDKALSDTRNAWAQNKQFVMGDDVTGQDQRKHADRLKAMITQEFIRIDEKYVPSYVIEDLINYLFTSNHPDAFFLEDRDRRDFVHEVTCAKMTRQEVDEYIAWLHGDGPSHLFQHLLDLDLGDQRAEDPALETMARAAMIDDGQSRLGRWVRDLCAAPDAVLRVGDALLQGDLWSSQDLLTVYDPDGRTGTTASAMSKELKRAGLKQIYRGQQLGTSLGPKRLFAVRSREQWEKATGPAAIHHYEATRVPVKRRKMQR